MTYWMRSDPPTTYKFFLMHVKTVAGKFTKKRSSLRGLCTYLEKEVDAYFKQSKAVTPFLNVADVKRHLKNPNDPRLMKYEPCFRQLVESWGKKSTYRSESNVQGLLRRARSELNYCKNFACTDAVTFETCIPEEKKPEVLARAKKGRSTGIPAISNNPMAFLRNANAAARPGGEAEAALTSNRWNVEHLKTTHERVYRARAGECTSFGYAAAYVLHREQMGFRNQVRIEVVSWRKFSDVAITGFGGKPLTDANGVPRTRRSLATHVYVIVNRSGATTSVSSGSVKRRQLPPVSEWGNDCYIVDCWAASLGYESIFQPHEFPYRGMLSPLYQEMDSLTMFDE